jgi:hypothetical protein
MELQNSDAQTSFVFNKEAEIQSAIYLVAETQEPATNIEVELQELETLDAAKAVTQEPASDPSTKEVETQDAATPPSTTNMAKRPATYSVAETQKPPTDMEIDEILLSLHQEAEIQQPDTAIDIEIQELEVEGAETLLSLHQEAETQAS